MESELFTAFNLLRQSADTEVVDALERLIRGAPDHQLCRINALDFLSWNVLCPACGGVLNTHATLRTVRHEEYVCELCAAGFKLTLDELVEVVFTVGLRARSIAAHSPETLPIWEYYRQILWGSGVDLPEAFRRCHGERHTGFSRTASWREGSIVVASPCGIHRHF